MSCNHKQHPDTLRHSSDEIMRKLNKLVEIYHPAIPSPLQGVGWDTIDALEAALLISTTTTSMKLHEIAQTSRDRDPRFLATANACVERYSNIMKPAHVCCNALNEIREGSFQGESASLEVVLTALKYVKNKYNPILAQLTGSLEQNQQWILSCMAYVEKVVAAVEHAASVLKGFGLNCGSAKDINEAVTYRET